MADVENVGSVSYKYETTAGGSGSSMGFAPDINYWMQADDGIGAFYNQADDYDLLMWL